MMQISKTKTKQFQERQSGFCCRLNTYTNFQTSWNSIKPIVRIVLKGTSLQESRKQK